jgi:WD40 repeat protein
VVISPDNAASLVQRAVWGKGWILEQVSLPNDRTLLVTPLGIYLYRDSDTVWLAEYPGAVRSLASPDAKQAALLFPDASVQLIDLADGAVLHTLDPQGGFPTYLCPDCSEQDTAGFQKYLISQMALTFSADSRWLAIGYFDTTIGVWDTDSGELAASLYHDSTGFPSQLLFTPDNRQLVALGESWGWPRVNRLSLWSLEEQAMLWYQVTAGRLAAELFSPDGNLLGIYFRPAGAREDVIRLYRAKDGTLVAQLAGTVTDRPYSPDSKLIVTTNRRNVQVFSVQPDYQVVRTLYTQLDGPAARFSEDGQTLALNGGEQVFSLPDYALVSEGPAVIPIPAVTTESDPQRWMAEQFLEGPRGLIPLANGELYVWGGYNPVWRWQPLTGQVEMIRFPVDPQNQPSLSAEGDRALACLDGLLAVYSFAGEAQPTEARCFPNTVTAFLPGGGEAVVARGSRITLIDLASGARLQDFVGSGMPVAWLEVAPSGKAFASGGRKCSSGGCQGDLYAWQIDPPDSFSLEPDGSIRAIDDLAFTAQDDRLVGAKGAVWGWNLESGLLTGKLRGEGTYLALSPDDRLVAIATGDTIYLVELETRRTLAEYTVADTFITGLAFTPDGANLLSTDAYGQVRLWGVP